MKLSSGKRIGQSGGELAAAAFFSFFLHGIIIAAVFLYVHAAPKKYFPPVYDVKLVGQPAESTTQLPQAPQAPPAASPPAPPKQEAKALPKEKKAAPKASKATVKKGAMPELAGPPQKPVLTPEPAKPEEQEQPVAKASGKAGSQTGPAGTGESVAVTSSQQDFKFGYYLGRVRDKIGQNWRPPPDAPDAKIRVVFTINRSGWVSRNDVNIDEKNSSGSYQFKLAAMRAILSANPFPQLPDDFPKQTLELTVDLMAEQ